jgi:predicted nucleic acid-binding Zn ribbon protein
MPIYLYRNLKTGETFEIEQRMKDDALTVDPVTGDPVKRLIQPVGIVFKGSGFYVNDSRGGDNTAVPAAGPASEAAAPAAAPAKADSAASATPAPAAPAPKAVTQTAPGK